MVYCYESESCRPCQKIVPIFLTFEKLVCFFQSKILIVLSSLFDILFCLTSPPYNFSIALKLDELIIIYLYLLTTTLFLHIFIYNPIYCNTQVYIFWSFDVIAIVFQLMFLFWGKFFMLLCELWIFIFNYLRGLGGVYGAE